MTLDALLDRSRVLLCVGSGGVGKTTTAAAIALEAARRGKRTVVLTVDPAQRLKDALGLTNDDGQPRPVPGAPGHLDAVLLDVKRTFDDLVRALSGTPADARRVLDNRLYQNLSAALPGTAEYMAVETVFHLATERDYDLVVVDTPPAAHAVDFLDAPRRLLSLLDSKAFAILKDPSSLLPAAGSRIAALVLTGVLRGLERFTGVGLVRELSEFVRAIESLTVPLRARVADVQSLLSGVETHLVLVTAPEQRLALETEVLARSLGRLGLHIHGVVVNRALPRALFLGDDPAEPPPGISPSLAVRLRASIADLRILATRQAATIEPILRTARAPLLAEVPLQAAGLGSLDDLAALGTYLFPDTPR